MTNTTIANHGCRRQKWPPSAPQEALRSTPTHQMDCRQPPNQADIILGGVEGMYGLQNTLMLWHCIITITLECFEGHTHHKNPQNYTRLLGGLLPIHSIRWCGAQGLMWGARRNFLQRQLWLWWLWRQLFCAKARGKCNKKNKISYLYKVIAYITIKC